MPEVSALTTDMLSLFTPSTTLLLLAISTLYSLTLSSHPRTPSFSLDYLLHLMSILFPPLPYIYFLTISYILTLLAISKPIHATPFLIAVWYTLLYGIHALNTRLGNGKARKVVWREQIAVVTGGAGGLGWMIAEVLERKGCGVVVWDVKKPDEWTEDEEGIRWYKVDVGDSEAVEKAYEKVKRDVCTISFRHVPKAHLFLFSICTVTKEEVIRLGRIVLIMLYADSTTARHPNHPDKQRRNRKRSPLALPNTIPIHPHL